jgi:hypothetical protein
MQNFKKAKEMWDFFTKADIYKHGNDAEWLKGVTGSKNGLDFNLVNGTPKFTGALGDVNLGKADSNFASGLKNRNGDLISGAARDKIMDMADDATAKQIKRFVKDGDFDAVPKPIRDYFGNDKLSNLGRKDLAAFRRNASYTWHEYIDEAGNYITQLVSSISHGGVGHAGGINDIKTMLGKLSGMA